MSIVYHKLADGNLTQDWSNSSLISHSDNWSGVPSIQGFANIAGAHGLDVDPRTLTGESKDVDVSDDVFKSPSKFNLTGDKAGIAEFQDFGIVALGGSNQADAPNLVVYLDTTDVTAPVILDFDVQDLDSSAHDSDQQLNVQYRIGDMGPWINVPDGYLPDVTEAAATPTTHVSVTLPLDAMGEPQVQLRIMTTNASGRDEWIGIDNINVAVACFLRGTLIRTPDGEVPVESLAIGDAISTLNRGSAAIKWIGRRSFSTRFMTPSSRTAPVLIRAGAIADCVPHRDLRVSPEHALFIEGALVPAIHLVNGRTIVREVEGKVIEYFHIEFDDPDIILADGAPAETYLNHNNRRMFVNWKEYVALYGEDAPRISSDSQFARAFECVTSGPRLDAIRARLEARAEPTSIAA